VGEVKVLRKSKGGKGVKWSEGKLRWAQGRIEKEEHFSHGKGGREKMKKRAEGRGMVNQVLIYRSCCGALREGEACEGEDPIRETLSNDESLGLPERPH